MKESGGALSLSVTCLIAMSVRGRVCCRRDECLVTRIRSMIYLCMSSQVAYLHAVFYMYSCWFTTQYVVIYSILVDLPLIGHIFNLFV